jgi:two-component system, NtrC family, sensor kinase
MQCTKPGAEIAASTDPVILAAENARLVQELAEAHQQQAAIAIENERLIEAERERARELTEALDQQTATSEILRVISGSPSDAQPVFYAIARSAAQLCKARFCRVYRFDGELIHFAAHHGLAPEGVEVIRSKYPMPPGRASATARSILSGTVEEIPDVDADPDYQHGTSSKVIGYRSIVAVPMLKDGRPIGAIVISRSQAGQFPERQIALLQTFADQAVIAIENARLFEEVQARTRELTEALEQRTATSEILRVISQSPTDVQPVFDTIVESAVRLCEAGFKRAGAV